jgi:hypothetical protein
MFKGHLQECEREHECKQGDFFLSQVGENVSHVCKNEQRMSDLASTKHDQYHRRGFKMDATCPSQLVNL